MLLNFINTYMKSILSLVVCAVIFQVAALGQTKKINSTMKSETNTLTCKLTTPELQARKKTVIAELKTLVVEKLETDSGVKLKFQATDAMIDLATTFIKTERLCCDFFDFNLSVNGNHEFLWLELSGPQGTREFIHEELGF